MLARACVFVMVVASAFAQEAAPRFEVATIKASRPDGGARTPDGPLTFSARSAGLSVLMQLAYDVRMDQVAGVPREFAGLTWDVVGKTAQAASPAEKKRMLQTLLAERFHLEFHREKREAAVYALTVGKGGPKTGADFHPSGEKTPAGTLRVDMKRLAAVAETALRHWIPSDAGRDALPVVDETELAGEYDVRLPMGPTHDDWVAILEDRTGLKLERRKMPVEVLAIDRAEKPAED